MSRNEDTLKRLPETTWNRYGDTLEALKRRYKPDSKCELYAVQFRTYRKCKTESWPDFAEDLQKLADQAFTYLQEEAKKICHLLATLTRLQIHKGDAIMPKDFE